MKKAAVVFLVLAVFAAAPVAALAQNTKPCADAQYLKGIKGLDVFVILAGDNVPDKGVLVATLKKGTEELLQTIGLKSVGQKDMAAPSKDYGILFVHVISKKLYDGSYAAFLRLEIAQNVSCAENDGCCRYHYIWSHMPRQLFVFTADGFAKQVLGAVDSRVNYFVQQYQQANPKE